MLNGCKYPNDLPGPAADPTSANTTAGPHASDLANKADPRVDSDNDRNTSLGGKSTETPATTTRTEPQTTTDESAKTGGIGSKSWFSTAIPFIGGKKEPDSSSVNTTAAASSTTTTQPQPEQTPTTTHSTLEDVKSQPPNVLPSAVPTGTSTDFAAPGSAPITTTSNDPMHAHQDIPTDTVGGNSTSSSAQPAHSLAASRASIAPEKPDHTNAPLKPAERGGQHGSNPSAIPLAGGKKIGEDAYTERKSFQADATDSSIPPPAAGMGSETTANTARNVGTAEAGAGRSSIGEKESVTSGTGSGHSEGKEKKSLKEKIKEKVHKH